MVSRYVFDSSLQTKVERDPNQALNVYAGTDNFLQIGEPEVNLSYCIYIYIGIKYARKGKL
jgi:hypothetical protein